MNLKSQNEITGITPSENSAGNLLKISKGNTGEISEKNGRRVDLFRQEFQEGTKQNLGNVLGKFT